MAERLLSRSNTATKTGMMINSSSSSSSGLEAATAAKAMEHKAALACPRCESTNTKFCYYNNYSLAQPRHFCKACKRYWTRGGTLRNVPVGGGSRKNKQHRLKKPPVSAATATPPPAIPILPSSFPMANLDSTLDHASLTPLLYPSLSSDIAALLPDFPPPPCPSPLFHLSSHLNPLGLGYQLNHFPPSGLINTSSSPLTLESPSEPSFKAYTAAPSMAPIASTTSTQNWATGGIGGWADIAGFGSSLAPLI